MIFNDAFIEPAAPLGSDLEWMLQSEQVSDQALAERLILDYHARAVSLALICLGDEGLAEQAASAALKEIVQERRKFWGNESLQAWIYAHLVRQVQHRANWIWRWHRKRDRAKLKQLNLDHETRLRRQLLSLDLDCLLPLALVFGHELSHAEASAAMKLPEGEFDRLLAKAREQAFALEAAELEHLLNLHAQFEPVAAQPETQPPDSPSEISLQPSSGFGRIYRSLLIQVAAGLKSEVRQSGWKRIRGELILGGVGACLALVIGWNALALEPVVTPGVNVRVVYITSTPQPGQEFSIEKSLLVLPNGDQAASDSDQRAFPTPQPTPTPKPRTVTLDLSPILAEIQPSEEEPDMAAWQNSGPFNLAILLRYLDQEIDLQQLSAALRPNPLDTGIFPYEIEEYIFNTPLRASYRFGGDIDTLRSLIGYELPVLVQQTYHGGDIVGWAAEYTLVYGFDDFDQQVHVLKASAETASIDYAEFLAGWLPFGYAYFVIYPPERSGDISQALERDFGDNNNYNDSLGELASENPASDLEQFWIQFSQGTILTYQSDFANSAQVFDRAFEIYQRLPEDQRPIRALWYNSRPYWAYFYSGQYDKVVSLADQTLNTAREVGLEESLYWRALAYEALGNVDEAMSTLKQAVELNPNFAPGKYQLERLQSGG